MSPALDLLAIAAHPDDAELSCGGLLALAGDRGQRAGILDLTRGEAATNGTPAQRAAEAAAAAAVLGLAVRENAGLPDGGLRGDDAGQADAVVERLRRLRPALLLAPWWAARHPDHAAASALAERAVFLAGLRSHRPDLGAPFRPRTVAFYPERRDARPAFVVDTSAAFSRKIEALRCHASQFGAGGEATLLNGPLGLAAFEIRDRYWGATIGATHGEPYVLREPVPIADPVGHFAAHPGQPVLWPAP